MKKLVWVVSLLVLLVTVYAQVEFTVYPGPKIVAKFDEEAIVLDALVQKNGFEVAMDYNTTDNLTISFTPQYDLADGAYRFVLSASDILGTADTYTLDFEVQAGLTMISIDSPSYGVSAANTFPVVIKTSKSSNCNYTAPSSSVDPNNLPPIGSMNPFNSVDERHHLHTINSITLDADTPQRYLYVKCQDFFGSEVQAVFLLKVLSQTPDLQVSVKPTTIAEPNLQGSYTAKVNVTSNQDVVCKYSDKLTDSFLSRTYFDNQDFKNLTSFKKDLLQNIIVTTNGQIYTYYVECMNLAELTTTKTITFKVDTSTGLVINVESPPEYTSGQALTFALSTTKSALCTYEVDADGNNIQFSGIFQTEHSKVDPRTFSVGKHTVRFRCDPISGSAQTVNYAFTIDNTPPSNISFNKTSDVICGEQGDWEFQAEWEASDPESPVTSYEYSLKDSFDRVIVNWSSTSSNKIDIDRDHEGKDLNFTVENSYYLYVKATNAAGVTSEPFKSHAITAYNKTSVYCKEKQPPRGWVTFVKTENGANVTLHCSDDSGCDMSSAKYGFVHFNNTCIPQQPYTDVVEVLYDGIFCYEVYDIFGNSDTGAEEIRLTLLDSDGDGVPDINDICPNTKSDEIYDVDEHGCGPSERDTDGDGILDTDDLCPETEQGLNASYIDANGCYVDTDGDGMPDFWEDRYGLDKNDSTDANSDADGDLYTNLQEYQHGTDPTDSADYPFIDSDLDGISDLADRCPNTPGGVSVDSFGCSASQRDTDGDGVKDNLDKCPDTPFGKRVDDVGCPVKLIPLLLFIVGIVLLLGGAGFLIYEHILLSEKKRTSAVQYVKPESRAVYPVRKLMSLEDKRQMLARQEIERRKSERSTARQQLFSKFSVDKPAAISLKAQHIPESDDLFQRLEGISKEKELFNRLSKLSKSKSISKDDFSRLDKFAKMRNSGVFDALPKAKVNDVFEAMSKRFETKMGKDALDELQNISKKKKPDRSDIISMLSTIKAPKSQIKNVFAAVLNFLLDSGKITKKDVSSVLIALADQEIISKGDVADVLYQLRLRK